MKSKKILFTALIFFHLGAFACEQVEDILIWKGDTLTLFSNPLKQHEDYASLRKIIMNEIERVAYLHELRASTLFTNCHKGYQAEWVILNDRIFLNNIYDCHNKNIKVNLANIFPNTKIHEKIFASWIIGDLIVLQGEYFTMKQLHYHSVYEVETVLSVENGLLKNVEVFHNRVAKRSEFFENAKFGEVVKFTHKQINWNNLPDLKNKSIIVNLSVNINEDGQIESLDKEYTYYHESYLNKKTKKTDSTNFFLDADINDPYIKESMRVAKLIPEWDVVYQRGKIVGSGLILDFSERMRKQSKKR